MKLVTYCGEITSQILKHTPDIELVTSNYTAWGVETVIKDVVYDGQEYIMTIKPKR